VINKTFIETDNGNQVCQTRQAIELNSWRNVKHKTVYRPWVYTPHMSPLEK